ATDAVVLGICAGYQMLGTRIVDGVESGSTGAVEGFGLLPVSTRLEAAKVTALRSGVALGQELTGYQIHHGRLRPAGGEPWLRLDGGVNGDGEVDGEVDGVRVGARYGTTLHGLFEADGFRRAFLETVAAHRGKRFVSAGVHFEAIR